MKLIALVAVASLLSTAAAAGPVETFAVPSKSKNADVVTPVELFLPVGPGPFPAMVQIHGSGGPNKTVMQGRYAKGLNDMGVAVTISNSFINRGITNSVEQQSAVTHIEMMLDAYKTLEHLSKHPKIDPKRIGIFGFSKGGTVAYYTAFIENADWLLPNGPRFALHVPFYPGCTNNSYYVKTTGAPILLLLGAQDTYTGTTACLRLAEKIKATNSLIETIVYPNGRHAWDTAWGDFNNPKGENYVNCILDEKEDRSVVEITSGIQTNAKGGQVIVRGMQAAMEKCRTRGVSGGPDDFTRDDSFRQLKSITAKTFGLTVK